jgi:hypothetical protein
LKSFQTIATVISNSLYSKENKIKPNQDGERNEARPFTLDGDKADIKIELAYGSELD